MIQIIDYGAGNLQSVKNALEKLGESYEVIGAPAAMKPEAKIIFAGVGAAGAAMDKLQESGFDTALKKLENPFLGICLGMQLLLNYSSENDTECLGVVDGEVQRFPIGLTVPQIGWNNVKSVKNCPLFDGIEAESSFYFVNSYYAKPVDQSVVATSEYGITFCAAVKFKNFYGVQFHPEKSGEAGLKLLDNFIRLC